ncbi:MAG: hypothetical protein PVG99_09170 [Desulfobacteraceae bacterium]|jgi:hypothetical protein
MNDFQDINDLSAILFPHSSLSEPNIKKILSFFGPLTIFQPYYMDLPRFSSESNDLVLVQNLNPPGHLKPVERFKGILSEYKNWITVNPDKSYTAFLKASQGETTSEDTTWAIRRAIRQGGDQNSEPGEALSLKWHLVLHLAHEIEAQRQDADRLLRSLREKDSPLKGIVEEEEVENLFQDVPPFDSELMMQEAHWEQVYEAWFSLFGGLLKEHEFLITLNRQIMDHVSDLWREYATDIDGIPEMGVTFKIPNLSEHSLVELMKIKRQVFQDTLFAELKKRIQNIWRDPKGSLSALEGLSKEIENTFPGQFSSSILDISLKYLSPVSTHGAAKKGELLRQLSGQAIVLVDEEAS